MNEQGDIKLPGDHVSCTPAAYGSITTMLT